jgi:hypothetical protein
MSVKALLSLLQRGRFSRTFHDLSRATCLTEAKDTALCT